MDKHEIEVLENILYLYRDICDSLKISCPLDTTMIGDTLARLKSGEYVIRENPEY